MGNVVEFRPKEYTAKPFTAATIYGEFKISGTLCGSIDLAIPQSVTLAITPDEALSIIRALTAAREDVLENSRPFDDPRIID